MKIKTKYILNIVRRLLITGRGEKRRVNRSRNFRARRFGFKQTLTDTNEKFLSRRKRSFTDWRKFIYNSLMVLAGVAWGVVLYVLFFSPFFYIKSVVVTGTNLIPFEEVENVIRDQLQKRVFWLLPTGNIFFFNKNLVAPAIQNRYLVDYVEVSKDYPDTMVINLAEKISSVIWVSAGRAYFMDLQGNAIANINNITITNELEVDQKLIAPELPPTTPINVGSTNEIAVLNNEPPKEETVELIKNPLQIAKINQISLPPTVSTQFPLIYDSDNTPVKIGEQPITADHLKCLTVINESLDRELDILTEFFVTQQSTSTVIGFTNQPWKIYFDCQEGIPDQLNNLKIALGKLNDTNRVPSYFDLRYPNRVYYK